jgi:hypothetical protein
MNDLDVVWRQQGWSENINCLSWARNGWGKEAAESYSRSITATNKLATGTKLLVERALVSLVVGAVTVSPLMLVHCYYIK